MRHLVISHEIGSRTLGIPRFAHWSFQYDCAAFGATELRRKMQTTCNKVSLSADETVQDAIRWFTTTALAIRYRPSWRTCLGVDLMSGPRNMQICLLAEIRCCGAAKVGKLSQARRVRGPKISVSKAGNSHQQQANRGHLGKSWPGGRHASAFRAFGDSEPGAGWNYSNQRET